MNELEQKEYITELLNNHGYAETVVTLMYEDENLTQEQAEAAVDEVLWDSDDILDDIAYDSDNFDECWYDD